MKYLDKDGLEYAWKKIQTYLDKKTNNADLLNKIYPVGSIYLTMGDKSPADLFGGTWKKLSGGYLYATPSNAGSTGGSHMINITTSNLPAHTHSMPSHTHSMPGHTHSIPGHTHSYTRADSVGYHTVSTNEMPSHSHGYLNIANTKSDGGTSYGLSEVAGYQGRVVITFDGTRQTNATGGGASHNHGLSTSSQSTGSTGGTTGSAGNGNTGSTGGTSGSTGSGTGITFYPEYIKVYMWQRTA